MKTLNDYITIYSNIAKNLGYVGESVNMLVQFLAQASYISEVENITYQVESSLEKASLVNSKIQHCMDMMYSVFRGSCPRVIMKIRPTKYLDLHPYDVLVTSQNFNIHYLASGKEINGDNKSAIWAYTDYVIPPAINTTNEPSEKSGWYKEGDEWWSDDWYILGFIAPKRIGETLYVDSAGSDGYTTINVETDYYVECTSNNLSNDLVVELKHGNGETERISTTRLFAEHVMDGKIFDLTLPGFGSRLYFQEFLKTINENGVDEGQYSIKAQFYGFSDIEDYNKSELKKVKLKGGELRPFNEDVYYDNEYADGLYYSPSTPRDDLVSIHYKANRDRFTNTVMRSNSDISTMLEDYFPENIVSGGTSYKYTLNNEGDKKIILYYIPRDEDSNEIESRFEEFLNQRKSYYITQNIDVSKGKRYTLNFDIVVETYNNIDLNEEIGKNILTDKYENKFNTTIDENELRSIICKNANIKKVVELSYAVFDEDGSITDIGSENFDPSISYFKVDYTVR